jgi:hypothetical protein
VGLAQKVVQDQLDLSTRSFAVTDGAGDVVFAQ